MDNILQRKNNIVDYLFVFVIIIYAGKATVFVESSDSWDNPLGLILPIAFSIFIAFYHRISFSKGFYYFIIGYFVYNAALALKYNAIHLRFFEIYIVSFIISYITIAALKNRFFIYYENILYYLSIISLFFWGILIVMPGTLINIFHLIQFSTPAYENVESNIIVYTINSFKWIDDPDAGLGLFSLSRNAGFAWEPGAFACFLNLAIFINLIRTKFRIHNNIKLLIFIITLITTFSTTGFTLLMLLLLLYIYNQNIKYTILLLPFSVILCLFILTLPFMGQKITELTNYDTDEMIENSVYLDHPETPQRIQSLAIDFIDFLQNPILGTGGQMTDRWTAKLGADIATISGIGKVLSVFGIVGIIFFFYSLATSSIEFTKTYNFRGWLFPFLMIAMISISYSIIFNSLLLCFWAINSNYLTRKEKIRDFIDRIRIIQFKSNIRQNAILPKS